MTIRGDRRIPIGWFTVNHSQPFMLISSQIRALPRVSVMRPWNDWNSFSMGSTMGWFWSLPVRMAISLCPYGEGLGNHDEHYISQLNRTILYRALCTIFRFDGTTNEFRKKERTKDWNMIDFWQTAFQRYIFFQTWRTILLQYYNVNFILGLWKKTVLLKKIVHHFFNAIQSIYNLSVVTIILWCYLIFCLHVFPPYI